MRGFFSGAFLRMWFSWGRGEGRGSGGKGVLNGKGASFRGAGSVAHTSSPAGWSQRGVLWDLSQSFVAHFSMWVMVPLYIYVFVFQMNSPK